MSAQRANLILNSIVGDLYTWIGAPDFKADMDAFVLSLHPKFNNPNDYTRTIVKLSEMPYE